MNEELYDMLEQADPQELDALLADIALPENEGRLRPKRIRARALQKAGLEEPRRAALFRIPRKAAVLAVCAALALGIGAVAYAEDAREYAQAVTFFAENNLPTEGMSRGEIKEVWRDITTGRFSSGKTAETLNNALGVTGWELESPSPEQVGEMWAQLKNLDYLQKNVDGTGMEYWICYDDSDHYYVAGLRDRATVWTVSFPHAIVERCLPLEDGVIFWGTQTVTGAESGDAPLTWAARITSRGEVLWEVVPFVYERFQRIDTILQEEDGFAFIGHAGAKLFLSHLSPEGQVLSRYSVLPKDALPYSGIFAVPFRDGYLVRIGESRIATLSREGVLSDFASYAENGLLYSIDDMIEYGGKLWLSAQTSPAPTGGNAGGRDEIANVLNEIFSRQAFSIPDEEMTRLLRENYTALLLVCDPEGGAPETFYSIPGCLGYNLAVNENGELEWYVQSVRQAFFSPATSSFTIGGECQVYQYTFDENGTLLSQKDTGETTIYRK